MIDNEFYIKPNDDPGAMAAKFNRMVLMLKSVRQKDREWYVNGMDAGASAIEFSFAAVKIPSGEVVFKEAYADDAGGMSPENLVAYMGTTELSGQGDQDSLDGHFGIGAKISTLGHNRWGTIVASKVAGRRPVLICMYENAAGHYVLRSFDGKPYMEFDPTRNTTVPGFGSFRLADTVGAVGRRGNILDGESWTVVIFGGMSADERTVGNHTHGDLRLTGNNPHSFLSTKLLRCAVPTRVTIPDKTYVPGAQLVAGRNVTSRFVYGLLNKFTEQDALNGIVDLGDGVLLHWMVDTGIDLDKPSRRHGLFAFAIGDEVIRLESLDGNARSLFHQFHIPQAKAHKAINIVIEMTHASSLDFTDVGAYISDFGRNEFLWSDGSGDINADKTPPIQVWADRFRAKFPQELLDYLRSLLSRNQQKEDKDYDEWCRNLYQEAGIDDKKFQRLFCIQGNGNQDCWMTTINGGKGGVIVNTDDVVEPHERKPGPTDTPTGPQVENQKNQGVEDGPEPGTSRKPRYVSGPKVDYDDVEAYEMSPTTLMSYEEGRPFGNGWLNRSYIGFNRDAEKLIPEYGAQNYDTIMEELYDAVRYEATAVLVNTLVMLVENGVEVGSNEFYKSVANESLTVAVVASKGHLTRARLRLSKRLFKSGKEAA